MTVEEYRNLKSVAKANAGECAQEVINDDIGIAEVPVDVRRKIIDQVRLGKTRVGNKESACRR